MPFAEISDVNVSIIISTLFVKQFVKCPWTFGENVDFSYVKICIVTFKLKILLHGFDLALQKVKNKYLPDGNFKLQTAY